MSASLAPQLVFLSSSSISAAYFAATVSNFAAKLSAFSSQE
jgi:hypothetical protein